MRNEIRFELGRGIGDTQISLWPVEVKQENAYDEPVYAASGFTSTMKAEKDGGEWGYQPAVVYKLNQQLVDEGALIPYNGSIR